MFGRIRKFGGAFRRAFSASYNDLEAGRMERRLSNWVPSRAHVNTLIGATGKTVVARSRYLARNNGYAAGAVDCFASNLIGTGIVPSWILDAAHAASKTDLQAAWTQWTTECDAEGVTDFYGLQRRVARELFIGGEIFARFRPRRMSDGLSVPLQIELLPSEQLPTERNLWLENGNRVRQGIEFDKIGRRVAYHFWQVNPGDITQSQNFGKITVVPAEQVLHIHDPLESGQIRGLPRLTAAIVALWMLDLYDDAELDRKKTAALFSIFIKRQDTTPTFLDKIVEDKAKLDGSGTATIDLQPGVVHQLQNGEDIEVAAPAEVGQTYEVFQYRALTKFCAAVGLPYSSTTADTVRANYGSQRAAMLEMRRRMEALQGSVIIHQLCRPIVNRFLDTVVLSGRLKLKDYARDASIYRNVDWIPPPWDWIDPLKDIQAEVIAVNAGFKPRSRVVEAEGYDPIENDTRIKEDQDRAKDLGLSFAGSQAPGKEVAAMPTDASDAPPAAEEKPAGTGSPHLFRPSQLN